MKKYSFLLAVILVFGAFTFVSAQNTETRTVASFTGIEVLNSAKIILSSGSPQEVRVEGEGSTAGTKLNVEDNTLRINGLSAKIYIRIPSLEKIDIKGSASVTADSVFTTDNLTINISGNGKVTMPIAVNNLSSHISGIGKLNLSGTVNQLTLNVSGSAKLNAPDLQVKKCETNISGIAKCTANVTDELELNISGSGSFYYLTKPLKLATHISGIGKFGTINGSNGSDTTNISMGNHKVTIVGKDDDEDDDGDLSDYLVGTSYSGSAKHRNDKSRSHWGGLDLGFNQLMAGKSFSTTMPDKDAYLDLNSGKSVNVNLNVYYHDFPIYKRYVMFTTGIGISINNYRFNSDKTLRSDTNRVAAAFDYDKNGKQISYDKNKLVVAYYTLPLLLQFNTDQEKKKSFHIAAGFLCSYKFNSHLKLVYNVDGVREKAKRHDDYNVDPFRYDATVRLGYSEYTIYASYALSDLFKSGRGPEVHPFQVGISLSGW
jgi:hypothetical protein